ncbi:hypothetical protein G9A89_023160 [Geosiphon pyriformis]|nr:hypothetical protein G9A89_023160 [Geosiphon pyriformis]
MGMTAHHLGTLLEKAGEKTCIINCSLETGNRFHCAVVGFESDEELESAFLIESIFSGVHFFWARLDLVQCEKCEHFGHLILKCNVSNILPLISSELLKRPSFGVNCLQLARLYAKKNVSISCPTVFGGKLWAQVVSSVFSSGGSPSSSGLFSNGMSPIVVGLNDCLAVLECSLEILSDQVSVILKKLSFIELVPLAAPSCAPSLAVSVPLALVVDSDMALDNVLALANPPFSGSSESATVLSSSGSKVFISKVDGLESKMSALEASFSSILVNDLVWKVATCNIHDINISAKQENVMYWHFDSGNLISIITETKLSFLGAEVAIIMADSLACHVAKIEEIPGHVMIVHLLFKDKLLVSVVAVLLFWVGISMKIDLEEVQVSNSVWGWVWSIHLLATLCKSLAFAVAGYGVSSVSDFFNTDHCAVSVSVGLGGLLDGQLNSLHKQTNKDHWKFLIKTADGTKWSWFRDCTSAKLLAVFDEFSDTLACADIDGMWVLLEKVLVDSADEIFLRHWFINQLINVWTKLDGDKAVIIANMIQVGSKSLDVLKQLLLFRKKYRKSKIYKLKLAEKAFVQKTIEYCMEKFCSDKGAMIRSVLDQPFHKVVLDYLVVNDKLVLEPGLVKLGVNKIMKGWTRKRMVPSVVSDVWACQYVPLDYVRDNAFSVLLEVFGLFS